MKGNGEATDRTAFGPVLVSPAVLPRRRGFMAGTGGADIGSTGGPPSRGRWTRGTVEVLDTNVGSEIMCLVTERFRSREGVVLPPPGVVRPVTGLGEGSPASPGDIGVAICCANTLSPGFGDGRGEGRGVKSPGSPGAVKFFALK